MSPEPPGANGKASHPEAARPDPVEVTLPRRWFVVLCALIVLPWLIVAAIYLRVSAETAAPEPDSYSPPSTVHTAAPGTWGHLSLTPAVISPPLEYVSADWGRPDEPDTWHFPGTPIEVADAFLLASGLTREQVRRLRATARPDPRTKGLLLTPDLELVRSLTPEIRARLYLELGKAGLNVDQADPFRFFGSSVEAWLGGSGISPQTRQLVESLIYTDGEYLLLADPEVIRSEIRDEDELRRLTKALLRQPTLLVKLTVKERSEISALAEYWGHGGRRTDLLPLLESVYESAPDRSIDILHLLPTFARNHLYRYPRLTVADLKRPLLVNCLWSALNFFHDRPDDRFLDANFALKTLQRDYYLVEDNFQLGDVVAFVDDNNNLFHVATYLADDLVLSKNGTSPGAPWTITTFAQLKGYYRLRDPEPEVLYHRRKDM